MKTSRMVLWSAVVGLSVAPLLAVAPHADAGGPAVKVKCRVGVNPARVQIGAGANGLTPGLAATFQVTAPSASSQLTDKVDALGDAAAEWDSAIAVGDPVEGVRGTIAANFVSVNQQVTVTVSQNGAVVASNTTGCGQK